MNHEEFREKKIKTELYHDNFQSYKRYGIPKAQLVIADRKCLCVESGMVCRRRQQKRGIRESKEIFFQRRRRVQSQRIFPLLWQALEKRTEGKGASAMYGCVLLLRANGAAHSNC